MAVSVLLSRRVCRRAACGCLLLAQSLARAQGPRRAGPARGSVVSAAPRAPIRRPSSAARPCSR